jgi:hypothetical protein
MAEMEKGVKLTKIKRSDLDANPPEAVKKMLEKSLAKMRSKKHDYVPEKFVGKGGRGYILKSWIIHRGMGAPKVSKTFREAIRLTNTKYEHLLNNTVLRRMKYGGPRYAAMGSKR